MPPLISVVIPTYNRAFHLPETINSVLAQTLHDYEIIIVDDGSTDDTERVVASLDAKNVNYLRHKENIGVSAARNIGIKASRGEYLAFLDSDDLWMPGKISRQIELFKNNIQHLGVVYSAARVLDERSNTICAHLTPTSRGEILCSLLKANKLGGGSSSVMIRRQCFDDAGCFDESLTHCEDWDMWIRIAEKRYTFDYTKEELVVLTSHLKNSSADIREMILGREALLEKHRSLYRQYPLVHSTQHYIVGLQCFNAGMMTAGRKHFLDAFLYSEINSLSIKFRSFLQLLASVSGYRGYSGIKRILNHFQAPKPSNVFEDYR